MPMKIGSIDIFKIGTRIFARKTPMTTPAREKWLNVSAMFESLRITTTVPTRVK